MFFCCCTSSFSFLRLFLMNWGCYILGAVFVLIWLRTEENLRCLHLLSCPFGRGVGREASVKVWWRLTMVFGFVCLATWSAWTVWVVCRGLLLCATRWRGKWKIGQGPIEQCVGDFCSVSRGSVEKKIGRGPIEKCVEKFSAVLRGGVKGRKNIYRSRTACATSFGFFFSLGVMRWRKNGKRQNRLRWPYTFTPWWKGKNWVG